MHVSWSHRYHHHMCTTAAKLQDKEYSTQHTQIVTTPISPTAPPAPSLPQSSLSLLVVVDLHSTTVCFVPCWHHPPWFWANISPQAYLQKRLGNRTVYCWELDVGLLRAVIVNTINAAAWDAKDDAGIAPEVGWTGWWNTKLEGLGGEVNLCSSSWRLHTRSCSGFGYCYCAPVVDDAIVTVPGPPYIFLLQ